MCIHHVQPVLQHKKMEFPCNVLIAGKLKSHKTTVAFCLLQDAEGERRSISEDPEKWKRWDATIHAYGPDGFAMNEYFQSLHPGAMTR